MFRLDPETDLSQASMDTVEHWDSLGHLKLAMEIDQTLKVKLPGDRLGSIQTFPDLKAAVAQYRA